MPEHMVETLQDWLSACPYGEIFDMNYVEEWGRVYIVNVSIAIEKESEKEAF
jgi:hypothetical protein